MSSLQKPQPKEYAPYYGKYIDLVTGDNILESLSSGLATMQALFASIPADKWEYAYAPGKWTLKESIIHIIDTERIMAYRALCVARKDATPLPGFEQDDYTPNAYAASRSIESVIEEYSIVRAASISLFKNIHPDVVDHLGTASDCPVTPQALAYIIAGHELHHLKILKEKYLA